ncbi:MAG: DnaJ domain-containing protein [Treponemataceae bacterium]
MGSLYDDLGISKTASSQEIKKAYRDAAFKYHPDQNQGNAVAEEKFKKISAAYSVLGDDLKRKQYDMFGDTTNSPFGNSQGQSYNGNSNTGYDPFEEIFRRNARQGKKYSYTYYGPFSHDTQTEKPYSKKDFFFLLVKSLFSVGIAIFFSRFLFSLLGLMIIVPVFVNGVSGSIRALQGLFNVRGK